MNEKSSPEFLPTFESLGLRVIVRDDLPAVVHGLLIGTIAPDAAPTAVTLERLQWWMLDDDDAQEVALIDPVSDAIRGRFIGDKRVRGCCALGDDRVIYVEGRSVVSRSIAGDDRRVHCAEAFGEEEFPTAHPLTDGRVVLLNVSRDDERASVRVIELEGTRELRSIELGARPILSGIQGQNIIVRAWLDEQDGFLCAFDRQTLQERWRYECGWSGDDDENIGRTLDTDAPRRAFGEGPIVITTVSDGLAVIDPRDGAARTIESGEDRWLFEVDATVARRAALLQSRGVLDVRSVADRSTVARFALREPVADVRAMSDGRWLILCGMQLVLVRTEPSAVLAGALLPRQTADTRGGRLSIHDGWIAVEREVLVEAQHEPLPRSRALNVVQSLDDSIPVELPLLDALLRLEEPAVLEALPVHPARIDAIVRIAEEEQWNDRAAWERLVAQGLVDERYDRSVIAVTNSTRTPILDPAQSDRTLTHHEERSAWLALAHDAPLLVTAAPLAREFLQCVRPFCAEPTERVTLTLDRWGRMYEPPRALHAARDAVQTAVTWRDDRGFRGLYQWLCESDALWSIAQERGASLPPTAPPTLVAKKFQEVRSPFAPLIALFELGMPPTFFDHEALGLRLEAIEGGGRVNPNAYDDIPF